MSSAAIAPLSADAKVPESSFQGILWAGTAISLGFLFFRLYVKLRSFRTLYADDYLVIFAWAMLLGTSILWQTQIPMLYEQYAVFSGHRLPTPDFLERNHVFIRTIVPFTILFYSCLWTVKLSFLIFFRRLEVRVTGQRVWWWVVLVLVLGSWVACVADIEYNCSLGSMETILGYCTSLDSIRWVNRTFLGNCAADVITDCLIISIPVLMLWNVRVPLRQKVFLMAIFSVTFFVMVVAIIRVAVVYSETTNADISWLFLWSNVEMATSIIIACVASFRQLFVNVNNQRKKAANPRYSRRRFLPYLGFRSKGSKTKGSTDGERQEVNDKWESQTRIVPLDSIHVDHNISVTASKFVYDEDEQGNAWERRNGV